MLIHKVIDFQARNLGDAPMLGEAGGDSLTYVEGAARVHRMAHVFSGLGVGRGDRVAILAQNQPDAVLAVVALAHLGAVAAVLNWRLAPAEIAEIVTDLEPAAVLAPDDELLPLLDMWRKTAATVAPVIDRADWTARVDAAEDTPFSGPDIGEDDTVLQLYTSGTTGLPKGVRMTHRNLVAAWQRTQVAASFRTRPGDTELLVAPIFHIGGIGPALFCFFNGARILTCRTFHPVETARILAEERIAYLFMVPAMIHAMVAMVPNLADYDFSALRLIGYGASPISDTVLKQAIEVFGCGFCQYYGMTEATGAIVCLSVEDHEKALDGRPDLLLSAGRPGPDVEFRVVGPDGRDMPAGETGELVFRSPSSSSGYWRRPEETKATMADGWVRSGDAGYVDADGYVFVRDRVKDMVISGAENIYPTEVEKILIRHPDIGDVAVIGVPDERMGESLLACIVPRDGTGNAAALSAEAVTEFCRPHLAGYKIPRRIALMDSIPRNASGKILKTVLREPYWATRERRVS